MSQIVQTVLVTFILLLGIVTDAYSESIPSLFANIFFQSSRRALDTNGRVRQPRFSFFREFIEPIPGVLSDMFPIWNPDDPIVETVNGLVQGTIKESRDGRKYAAFLGIPYAMPPDSPEMRFEPPVKLTYKWEGIRRASSFREPCFQLDTFVSGRLRGNEDCLYTNIYTPKIESESLLPVMVYIHGGGYTTGSGDFYQGKYFMDEDIVLVIFNYRLAALGFLNTEDGLIRGNMALKDQNMLLHWIQENIKNFGGDPQRVTLFGESVGAAMTQFHVLSPVSNGLFQKAISLSGSVFAPWAFSKAPSQRARKLAESCGCPTEIPSVMVKCLKELPLPQLAEGYKELLNPVSNPADYFAPSNDFNETSLLEDMMVSKSPEDTLKEGRLKKIPLMMGVNSMEGLMHVSRILADKKVRDNFDQGWNEWIPILCGYDPANTTISEILRNYYFPSREQIDLSLTEHMLNLTMLISDGLFFHPVHRFAKLYAPNAPLYLYFNSYQNRFSVFDVLSKVPALGDNNELYGAPEITMGTRLFSDLIRYRFTNERPSSYGACHGDSVLLLFNTRRAPGIGKLSMDYEMSKSFVKTLTDFASSREPVSFTEIPWPVVKNSSDMPFMQLDLLGKVIEEPFSHRMELWDALVT